MADFSSVNMLVSGIAVALSGFSLWMQRDTANKQRQHEKNISDAERKLEWSKELRTWGEASIHTITQARTLYEMKSTIGDVERYKMKCDLLSKLSAQIDMGRMFFKNDISSGWGKEKEAAYQGVSPSILDNLKSVHHLVLDYSLEVYLEENSKEIIICQRAFVSDLQSELTKFDPEWQQKASEYSKKQ